MDYNMFGIPLEIIALATSTIGGFYATYTNSKAERLHEERLAYTGSVRVAREDANGIWVRRFIVLVMMGLLSFIIVAPAFLDVNTVLVDEGWLWTTTTEIKGIMYDTTTRTILTSIIGFYFGTAAGSR